MTGIIQHALCLHLLEDVLYVILLLSVFVCIFTRVCLANKARISDILEQEER